ncbi:integrase [Saccharothrix sp. NRRL B-16348]|nr:integrase [Saccharothrix sp. NRRL B-16348]
MLAEVRSLGQARRQLAPGELEDFEQELVDQYALALVGAGVTDRVVAGERSVLFDFITLLGRHVWTTTVEDADRFLALQRKRGLAASTIYNKAVVLTGFFDFLTVRYQGDVHALTGHVLAHPIDEFNRPACTDSRASPRVPPTTGEVDTLFTGWRDSLAHKRKFLTAARDYVAASLWRRVGLRIGETVMLDIRDWHPELGEHGKLHVRFGKGSRRRGPKIRLVPAINSADALLGWWLNEVRHQFDDDYANPDAPLFPSERYDSLTGHCERIGHESLRSGLSDAVATWLPAWKGRLTPHGLRHFCASSLYERGMDLKAIQELLGHAWLSTTTSYIHVHSGHIDHAWTTANQRVTARLSEKEH